MGATGPNISSNQFLDDGGEMGQLTREFDWSKTPIGPIDTWPQSLKTTLGILLHSAFPMFLFWGEDLTCFYNDAYRPSLGVDGKHPAVGKKGKEIWADIWNFIGPLIEKVIATGKPVYFEDQLVGFHRNGRMEDIYWTFSYSPAYGDAGQINGVFVTCRETTQNVETKKQLLESEQALKESGKKLEQLVRIRTNQLERSNLDLQQFAHVASHDLKEPVRKIKVFATRLKDGGREKMTTSENVYLDKILSAAERMSVMIDGVLAFSTMNSLEQAVDQIDMNQIMVAIQNDLEILITQKSAEIYVDDMPVIEGADVLIYQLFYNLITNSLKFSTPDKPPVIKISSSLFTEDEKEFVRISVTDNGIGFETIFAEKIFDAFTRLNSKDKFEGTGLGLALCKKNVERHRGTISADGSVNRGAEFIITLPIHQTEGNI